MTPGLGRRSGAAAALLLGLVVATPSSPAGAQAAGPEIEFESLKVDAPLDSSTVTVAGRATAQSLYRIKDITLTAGGETKTKPCTESQCSFSFQLTRPTNGAHQLKPGDTIELTTPIGGCVYQVARDPFVVAPSEMSVIDPTAERSLTLTTCHPKGSAAQRLIIRATWVRDLKAA